MDITVFVDESGTIAKGIIDEDGKDDYFIISMLFINNEKHLNKVFKKSRISILSEDQLKLLKEKKEIKGTELSETKKYKIYSDLCEKCVDEFEIGLIVLNNKTSQDRLRKVSSRAFNYLIGLYMHNFFRNYSRFNKSENITFHIDERNVATGARYELREYLNTQFNLINPICNGDIMVSYHDSKSFYMLQLSDYIANTFYRYYQKNDKSTENAIKLFNGYLCKKSIFIFPVN